MCACAASFCYNNRYKAKRQNANITFHKFPGEMNLRLKWIKFCKQNKNWTPSKQSVICSVHFKPEDYQLSNLPLQKRRTELLKLQSVAVPSLMKCKPEVVSGFNDIGETEAQEENACNIDYPIDPILLQYRDQFCRTCLNHCKDETLISVDSQLQNMTVLEMLIQLTAFETESNASFPTVICLDCKNKLEQAYNIRREFIFQSELLVQLVAEQKIMEHFKKVSVETHAPTQSRAPEESVFTEINQAFKTFSYDGLFSKENGTSEPLQEIHDVQHEEATTETFGSNDHSGYIKGEKHYDHADDSNSTETCDEYCAGKKESVAPQRPELSCTKIGDTETWECFERDHKQEKALVQKHNAEVQRTRRKKQFKTITIKRKGLKENISKCFPYTTCYICDTKHDTLTERDFHMREHVSMLPYQCMECTATTSNGDTQSVEYIAEDELIVLKTTNQLNLHFRMHRMPHKCEKCYHRFSTTTRLRYHLLAFHARGECVFTCEYCGKQYFDKLSFRKHVAHHSNEQNEKFKCTICDRLFGVKSSLLRHEASHKGEKKYKCLYCNKSYSTSYNRLAHQRTHTGERSYQCPDCDRAFSQSTRLKVHRKNRHNLGLPDKTKAPKSKPRAPVALPSNDRHCPYVGCDYKASTYTALYAHKRSKHKPTNHKCEVCNKSFPFANQLKTHFMLHTGEKPHRCTLCDRSFRLIKDYRWHMETHRSDITYSCPICLKSFKLQRYMQAHMLTHSAIRKFACEICGSSYKTKGELKKHSQQKHGAKYIEGNEEIIVEEDLCAVELLSTSLMDEHKHTSHIQ